jgi:hypothetical protein
MSRGLGLVLYGPPGIGKTHFATYFPKPLLFISLHETGFDDLKIFPGVPADITDLNLTDFNQLMDALGQCARNPHFKTVVIDSMSGFQQVFFDFLIKSDIPGTKSNSYKEAEKQFWAYFKGPRKQAPNCMPPFTSLLSSLLAQGTNVVLIGHKMKDSEFNEAGADYTRAVIDMDEGIRTCIIKWAPNVIYMSMQPNATQVTQSSGYGTNATPTQVKTDGIGNKQIYTQTNPQNDAKNKLGLPYFIPIGDSAENTYKTFWSLLPEAYKQ